MFSIFDSFPLINTRTTQRTSKVATALSLLVTLLIFLLFTLKMIELANHANVAVNSQTNYESEPSIITLTTKPSDSNYVPFMAGFSLANDNSCSNGIIKVDAFASVSVGEYNTINRTTSRLSFTLQNCTQSHFSSLNGGLSKIKEWSTNQLYCLPINRYYELGGSNVTGKLYKNLQFTFTCPTSCSNTCGKAQFFTLNAQPNLYNSSSPFAFYLDRRTFSVESNPTQQNLIKMDTVNITTDSSLLPFSIKNAVQGIQVGQFVNDITATGGSTSTMLIIEKSDKLVFYNRSFLKLFQVLAYTGGLIQIMLAVFMFLSVFSRQKWELQLARSYFKTNSGKSYSFGSYIKQKIYNVLRWFGRKVDWELAKERQQLQSSIEKYLDVYYINRRLLFLEDAISLLFESHHLKGLYLMHTLTTPTAEQKLKHYRLRDRILTYISQNQELKVRANKRQLVPAKAAESRQNNREVNNSQKLLITEGKIEEQIEKRNKGISRVESCNIDQFPILKPKRSRISLKMLIEENEQSQKRFVESQNIKNQAQDYYQESINAQYVNNREKLESELKTIGKLTDSDLDESELLKELQTDIKKLLEQGQKEKDQRSGKIVSRLQDWLKFELKQTLLRKGYSRKRDQSEGMLQQ